MLEIKKYGAIDVGSNAIRLLISNIIIQEGEEPKFSKSALVRVPIRLGQDSFITGVITNENSTRMVNAMKAFKLLMGVHGVEKYKACATSAMRDAINGKEIIETISNEADIDIEIIDGKKEAQIIATTDITAAIDGHTSYLYVDVGGGSTEFTVFHKNKVLASKSFKIGTVRLLNKKNTKVIHWDEIEAWIKINTQGINKLVMIGSGGNINKIFKMSGQVPGKPLSYVYMKTHYQYLKGMTYEERITILGLNPDRADVIIPATKIFLSAMKWSGIKKIFVPKIGLADGIIKSMYNGIL